MSTLTTRNSLVKPSYADPADIAVINSNYDTIDASFAKCNWSAGAAPTVNDDFATDGYSIGSLWFDTTAHKLYIAETVGTGTATWRQIYQSGYANAVLADGTVPLTANWDVGAFKITADTFTSDVADGTAPFASTSKTVCTNLNADMIDGNHAADLVTQALADAKGDLIVASAANTWARQAVGATDSYSLVSDASATNGVSWQTIQTNASRNLLINPTFAVNQPAITTYTSATSPANSDDNYLMDQWILLSDGNDIVDVSPYVSGTATIGQAVMFDVETQNKKFGFFQVIENRLCKNIIGGTVSLRFLATTTAGKAITNIMAAVVSWSSTSDTVTSDIVSAWENAGTAPTLVANWTYENVPSQLALVAGTWTEYKIENISIDTASTTNVGVFIWCDDTDAAVEDVLYLAQVQLSKGPVAFPWVEIPYALDLLACKRYMMIWNSDAGAYGHVGTGVANDTEYAYIEWPHPTSWRATAPAMTLTGSLALFDVVATESLQSTIVIRVQDTAKGLTAGHSYVVYAGNDTTMRVTGTSRL